jgi:hypothetical protein
MEVHIMENDKYTLTFKTSASQDDKDAGDTTTTTTTIQFLGWNDEDFKAAAAETVKVRQIQVRIRNGKKIGPTFIASRPGHKAPQQDPVEATIAGVENGSISDEQLAKLIAAMEARKTT